MNIQFTPTVTLTASQTTNALGINQTNPQYTLDCGGTGNFLSGIICSGNFTNGFYYLTGTGSYVLPSTSFIVASGAAGKALTGVLPSIVGTVGIEYTVCNKGSTFLLTGSDASNLNFYSSGVVGSNFSCPSGSVPILLNDGAHWTVL